jgi:hypothetical protein
VKASPAAVEVLLWGEHVCTTGASGSCTFRVGETPDALALTFRKQGYAESQQELALDGDKTIEITLERQKRAKPAGGAAKKPKPPAHKPSITTVE